MAVLFHLLLAFVPIAPAIFLRACSQPCSSSTEKHIGFKTGTEYLGASRHLLAKVTKRSRICNIGSYDANADFEAPIPRDDPG